MKKMKKTYTIQKDGRVKIPEEILNELKISKADLPEVVQFKINKGKVSIEKR